MSFRYTVAVSHITSTCEEWAGRERVRNPLRSGNLCAFSVVSGIGDARWWIAGGKRIGQRFVVHLLAPPFLVVRSYRTVFGITWAIGRFVGCCVMKLGHRNSPAWAADYNS